MSTQYRYAKPADADLRRVERRNDPQRRYAQRTIRRRHREKDNVRTRLQFRHGPRRVGDDGNTLRDQHRLFPAAVIDLEGKIT